MHFITGVNRVQAYYTTLNDNVAADNPLRLIEVFVEKLEFLPSRVFSRHFKAGLSNGYMCWISRIRTGQIVALGVVKERTFYLAKSSIANSLLTVKVHFEKFFCISNG